MSPATVNACKVMCDPFGAASESCMTICKAQNACGHGIVHHGMLKEPACRAKCAASDSCEYYMMDSIQNMKMCPSGYTPGRGKDHLFDPYKHLGVANVSANVTNMKLMEPYGNWTVLTIAGRNQRVFYCNTYDCMNELNGRYNCVDSVPLT